MLGEQSSEELRDPDRAAAVVLGGPVVELAAGLGHRLGDFDSGPREVAASSSEGCCFTPAEAVEVLAEAATGKQAAELADEHLPDVVVMDVQKPDGDGIAATRTITTAHPGVAVLVVTMHDDDTVFAALRAGARGYLLKGAEQSDVIGTIRSVAGGHVTLGPGSAERVLASFETGDGPPPPFPVLTDRERQVLRLVAERPNNRRIAGKLDLSPKTVANHVSNILTKLHFVDRAEAIVQARRAELTDEETRRV